MSLEAVMNRESTHNFIRESLAILVILGSVALGTLATDSAFAQVPVDEEGNPIAAVVDYGDSEEILDDALPLLTAVELETLVGPVALYPDDLLAIVLPASTYPLEIVQAARFLEQLEIDPTLEPNEDWDDSIIALLNYPEVVQMMNEDIDWTWQLGEAVIAQQNDLVAAVEVFRDRAYAAGNLKTDEYQTVTVDEGIIEIEPANDEVIYVPYYEPEQVVYYSPGPVYYYYPRPYPVYYYPYPAGHYFGSRLFWGVSTAFTIGWASDYLHVYHHSYYGHPYYGYSYYGNHYRHASINVHNTYYVNNNWQRSRDHHSNGDYWRPRQSGGARQVRQTARNNYYSGNQRSNTTRRSYRDNRTDGLEYNKDSTGANGNFRSSRRSDTSGNSTSTQGRMGGANPGVADNRTRQRSRSVAQDNKRPALELKKRAENRYTGSVARRIEAGNDNSSRPIATRTRISTRNSGDIKFRARANAPGTTTGTTRDTTAATRSQRRSTTPTRVTSNQQRNRSVNSAANSTNRTNRANTRQASFAPSTEPSKRTSQARTSTQSHKTAPRSPARQTATRSTQARQTARAAPSRQAAKPSAPRQTGRSSPPRAVANSRPASKPAQTKQASPSRPSSSKPASRASSNTAGNSRGSAGSSRPSRKR